MTDPESHVISQHQGNLLALSSQSRLHLLLHVPGMSAKLPLINLYSPISKGLVSDLKDALLQFGAFRLAAPGTTRYNAVIENVSQVHFPTIVLVTNHTFKARVFFKQPIADKAAIADFSHFGSESVRSQTKIFKESAYFFRNGTELDYPNGPCSNFYHSVKSLNEVL